MCFAYASITISTSTENKKLWNSNKQTEMWELYTIKSLQYKNAQLPAATRLHISFVQKQLETCTAADLNTTNSRMV